MLVLNVVLLLRIQRANTPYLTLLLELAETLNYGLGLSLHPEGCYTTCSLTLFNFLKFQSILCKLLLVLNVLGKLLTWKERIPRRSGRGKMKYP